MIITTKEDIIKTNLVLYWDWKERSNPRTGTSWYDLSGNNNTGTLSGGTSFYNDTGSVWLDNDNALGSNTQVVNIKSPTNLAMGTGTWSASAWVNVIDWVSFTDHWGIIGFDSDGICTYNKRYVIVQDQNAVRKYNNDIPLGVWHNVCATRNESTYKIYVNGVENSVSASVNAWKNTGYGIGYGFLEYSYPNAYISSVAVWKNKVLTQEEVTHNFNVLRYRFGV